MKEVTQGTFLLNVSKKYLKNRQKSDKLRAVIGDSIILSSQTYRNSEYTVFIRMGSMGGRDAGSQDAVAVYGQWNGTSMTEDMYGE